MLKGSTSPCFNWIPAGTDPLPEVSFPLVAGCPLPCPRVRKGTDLDASRIPCATGSGLLAGAWREWLKPDKALGEGSSCATGPIKG